MQNNQTSEQAAKGSQQWTAERRVRIQAARLQRVSKAEPKAVQSEQRGLTVFRTASGSELLKILNRAADLASAAWLLDVGDVFDRLQQRESRFFDRYPERLAVYARQPARYRYRAELKAREIATKLGRSGGSMTKNVELERQPASPNYAIFLDSNGQAITAAGSPAVQYTKQTGRPESAVNGLARLPIDQYARLLGAIGQLRQSDVALVLAAIDCTKISSKAVWCTDHKQTAKQKKAASDQAAAEVKAARHHCRQCRNYSLTIDWQSVAVVSRMLVASDQGRPEQAASQWLSLTAKQRVSAARAAKRRVRILVWDLADQQTSLLTTPVCSDLRQQSAPGRHQCSENCWHASGMFSASDPVVKSAGTTASEYRTASEQPIGLPTCQLHSDCPPDCPTRAARQTRIETMYRLALVLEAADQADQAADQPASQPEPASEPEQTVSDLMALLTAIG